MPRSLRKQSRPRRSGSFSAEDNNPGIPSPQVAPHSVQSNLENVTRSDLPPAPPTRVREATSPTPAPAMPSLPCAGDADTAEKDQTELIRGVGRSIMKNMESSLGVPTATSAREIPAKLMIGTHTVINAHLDRTVGGKISFTPPHRLRPRRSAGGDAFNERALCGEGRETPH